MARQSFRGAGGAGAIVFARRSARYDDALTASSATQALLTSAEAAHAVLVQRRPPRQSRGRAGRTWVVFG